MGGFHDKFHTVIFYPYTIISNEEIFFSRFPSNSEAFASELLGNLEEIDEQ